MSEDRSDRVDATGFEQGRDRMKTPGEFLAGVKNALRGFDGGARKDDGGEGGSAARGVLDGQWRASSFSNGTGGNNCVEVRHSDIGDYVIVRNSKDPRGGVLAFTRDEWTAFLAGADAGEFDL